MKKLYKRKVSQEEMLSVQSYIGKYARRLFVEIWVDDSDDGDVYDIQVKGLQEALHVLGRYYDSVSSSKKVAELIMQDGAGEMITVYHIERNREGITYEILGYAKAI